MALKIKKSTHFKPGTGLLQLAQSRRCLIHRADIYQINAMVFGDGEKSWAAVAAVPSLASFDH